MSERSAPAMQRIDPLLKLPALLSKYGVSLEQVIRGLPISEADFTPGNFIPFAAAREMIERAAELSNCRTIGLQLGAMQSLEVLGPVGTLMSHAATLGEALSDYVSFQIGNSTGASAYLHRLGEDFTFGYGFYDSNTRYSAQIYELAMAVGCNLIRSLTQDAVRPLEVLLIGRPAADQSLHIDVARCPIRFDQTQCSILLSASSMSFRLRNANREEHERLFSQIQQHLLKKPIPVSVQVRHALRPLMLQGRTTLPEVADHLGMHQRTLGRRLEQEGVTFESIKDLMRYTVARELLALTNLPAGDIASSLGYGSSSTFVHAFHRWAGMPPTHWRRENRKQ
jgi:AraC-like DNA-binding protein